MPERASTLAVGIAAYRIGDFDSALKIFTTFAERGHPRAQTVLGIMYAFGEGTLQDRAAAVKWYRKAADSSFAPAQYNLALLYLEGNPLPRSKKKAITWLTRAILGGHRPAEQTLRAVDSYAYAEALERARMKIALEANTSSRAPGATGALKVSTLRRADLLLTAPTDAEMSASAQRQSTLDTALTPSSRDNAQTVPQVVKAPPRAPKTRPLASASTKPSTGSVIPATTPRDTRVTNHDGHLRERLPQKKRKTAPTPSINAALASPAPGRFAVQLFATRSQSRARIRRDWFQTAFTQNEFEGTAINVMRAELGETKDVWFRVRAGPLQTYSAALELCARLQTNVPLLPCLPIETRSKAAPANLQ
ncbi:MAG: hypothetical protein ACI8PT_001659 [Gammaproteobacteria bacterium]|jgi:hypothetical protein